MAVLLGIVLGIILVGALIGPEGTLLGGVLGWLVVSHLGVANRLRKLELERQTPTETTPPDTDAEHAVSASLGQTSASRGSTPSTPEVPAPAEQPGPAATPVSAASTESPLVRQIRELVLGGNTAARIGIVVLFFGVAFLLKYAAERNLFPIELRLAGAAIGALALLAIGWRLRLRRRGYGLVLQGGGIGILYLTVFSAFHFYQLIPATAAFALLVAIAVSAAVLSVLQDSVALAVTAAVGGFLAPILVSRDSGNHILLFGYYTVLNTGILLVAWFKDWRLLNLVGFTFTFAIAAIWGTNHYQPHLYASTQPFLILFFLMYVTIALRFALRRAPETNDYIDATLIFGVPIIGFLLQAGLVREFEYGLAWSALTLGLFYLALGWALVRRDAVTHRLLIQAFLALGAIFATLAIPLALDGRWTSAAWAVEGAGILWIGIRQRRIAARLFGLILVLLAGAFFLGDRPATTASIPILNAHYLGALLVSLSALFVAALLNRHPEAIGAEEQPLGTVQLIWGLLWWYGAGVVEIDLHLPDELVVTVTGTFVALSCLAVETVGTRLGWSHMRAGSIVLLPTLVILLALQSFNQAHPFANSGYALWLIGLGVFYWIAYRRTTLDRPHWTRLQHPVALWLVTLVGALECEWVADRLVTGGSDWRYLGWLLAPIVTLAFLGARRSRWPLSAFRELYVIVGGVPVAAAGFLMVGWTTVTLGGDPAPLPYIPLLNPLDVAAASFGVALIRWYLIVRELRPKQVSDNKVIAYGAIGLGAFIWLNTMLFRTLHHQAGIDYSIEAMFASVLAQASISLTWSVLALAMVVAATRLRLRAVWITAAALIAMVVVKLFLIDLSGTGTVARIVSFLGVGALLLLIGYLAPVPPRATTGRGST